jgi:stage II sporulation protein D
VDPRTGLGVDDSIPPLAGVDLGEYAKESPKFQWTQKLEDRELAARLIENGISPHELLRVEAHETAVSGHAITLKLYDRTGHSSIVAATVFRHALGLFSTNFTATKTGSEWTFTGKGYGHGCGMCQWSARGMAKAGHDSNNIIETMYPGTVLKRLY